MDHWCKKDFPRTIDVPHQSLFCRTISKSAPVISLSSSGLSPQSHHTSLVGGGGAVAGGGVGGGGGGGGGGGRCAWPLLCNGLAAVTVLNGVATALAFVGPHFQWKHCEKNEHMRTGRAGGNLWNKKECSYSRKTRRREQKPTKPLKEKLQEHRNARNHPPVRDDRWMRTNSPVSGCSLPVS
ncbi:unnamed protein product [Pleuronectes platessa]|uniref:Uncharacterized protein n=1 Tax=Pleuronectes platessa TaxID=8262 RepID=A0A9N7VRE5_PLEPL|nr:unnamed protein product [Pleuronectes platessa]